MIKIQRLNMDTSWWISWGGTSFIVDPWLIGSEIDGGSWFNEQWHVTEPVAINDIPVYDFILITQSYNDHCHQETIEALQNKRLIKATTKAYNKTRKWGLADQVEELPDFSSHASGSEQLGIYSLHPGKKIDPVYYGVVITLGNEAIVIASHGFELNNEQQQWLSQFKVRLLITSFSEIQLPGFMGGKVNPGMDNVNQLFHQLKPEHIINTHDEQKTAKGLVMKLAKTKYVDLDQLAEPLSSKFLRIKAYEELTI
ncbi:MAG: MBL fold metallo-hydrolase [Cyclobacteriaceae bacterium]